MAGVLMRLVILFGTYWMKIQCIEISHWGNYFVFTFLPITIDNKTDVDNLLVITTSNVSSDINIICMETNETWAVSLEPFEDYKLTLNRSVTAMPFGELLPRKAVVVMASTKVSVYGFSAHGAIVDGFLVIPVAGLGCEYRTVSPMIQFLSVSQFAVVAVEDATELIITVIRPNWCFLNKAMEWKLWQSTINFTMSMYDVLNLYCIGDITGLLVQSNKPVAVLSGSMAFSISANQNHLVEMLPSTKDYGYRWAIEVPNGNDYTTVCRVIFHENTELMLGDSSQVFAAGDYKDIEIAIGYQFCFTTNKPALVVLFTRAKILYEGLANMAIIPPDLKYGNYYVVPHNAIPNFNDIFTLMAYTDIYLEHQETDKESAENCVGVFRREVGYPPLTKVFASMNPFSVFMYGHNAKFGYGLPAGFNVTDTSDKEECLSSPCLNNGWCIETSLSFYCYCPDGLYTGQFCETELAARTGLTDIYNSSQTITIVHSTTELLSSASSESAISDFPPSSTKATVPTGVLSTLGLTTNLPIKTYSTTHVVTEEVTNVIETTPISLQSSTESSLISTTDGVTTSTTMEEASNATGTMTISLQPSTQSPLISTADEVKTSTRADEGSLATGTTTISLQSSTQSPLITTTDRVTTSTTVDGGSLAIGTMTTSPQSRTESHLISTITEVVTSTTTVETSSTIDTTTLPQSSTDSNLTQTTNTTIFSTPIPEFRRIYFLCRCPCMTRKETSALLLLYEQDQKNNVLSKNDLSKTKRQKNSAENITKLEQNLGSTSLFIMVSVCSIIILLDLLKLGNWIKGYISRRKAILKEPEQKGWCSHYE